MDPTDTPGNEAAPKEQRILAAIVFTDAVGFSKLAGKDEQAALSILRRDFRVMGEFCERQGGKVLKTMGDGMLMMFPSAVDAMQAALNIQDALYAQALRLPAISILQHRIGVHLGDIIINGDDVFGDGVNVASRLQTEAKPGAICYSRTVADVIKNKVQVAAKYLGPRVLKNISEPVMVWQVPPIGDSDGVSMDEGVFSDLRPEEEGARGSKALALVFASVLLVALGIGALALIRPGPSAVASQKTNRRKPANLNKPTPPTTAVQPTPAPTSTSGGEATTASLLPSEIQAKLADLRRGYDFAAMRDSLTPYVNEQTGQVAKMHERYDQLAHLTNWMQIELASTTQENPVAAALAGTSVTIYGSPEGISVNTGGSVVAEKFIDLPPSTMLELAKAFLQKAPSGSPPPPMAPAWITAFASEYSL